MARGSVGLGPDGELGGGLTADDAGALDRCRVERRGSPGHPTHVTLLGAGVIVIEGLNLSGVEPGRYQLICLPIKILGGDGAPARAVLLES